MFTPCGSTQSFPCSCRSKKVTYTGFIRFSDSFNTLIQRQSVFIIGLLKCILWFVTSSCQLLVVKTRCEPANVNGRLLKSAPCVASWRFDSSDASHNNNTVYKCLAHCHNIVGVLSQVRDWARWSGRIAFMGATCVFNTAKCSTFYNTLCHDSKHTLSY